MDVGQRNGSSVNDPELHDDEYKERECAKAEDLTRYVKLENAVIIWYLCFGSILWLHLPKLKQGYAQADDLRHSDPPLHRTP
jgi:hypothetical protein